MSSKPIIKTTAVVLVAAALGAASGIALGDSDQHPEGGAERGLLSRLLGGLWGEREAGEHDGLRVASKEYGESEERERNEHERGERRSLKRSGGAPQVGTAQSALYASECGACHVAYPPALLPAGSWKAIMGKLADHFGENAELDPADQRELTGYLITHAGKRDWMTRLTSAGQTPLRVTELRWFRRAHDEVPARLVKDNPKVRSFANCDACHAGAARGSFDEDSVRIPGARGWE